MPPVLQVVRLSARPLAARSLAFLGVAIVCVAASTRAESATHYGIDADEILWMKTTRPAAAEKLERGEGLLRAAQSASDVERAAALFHEASREAPESALAPRRECQALSALGRHDAAVAACDFALARGGKVPGLRAAAGALMSGTYPPTPSEVGRALYYARRAVEIAPDQPWGYAAECDVAAKLGDVGMLNSCTSELARVARGHYEAERASTLVSGARPGFWMLVGWMVLGLLALVTIVHALRRAPRRASPAERAAVLLFLALVPSSVHAQTDSAPEPHDRAVVAGHLSKYSISVTDPESSVPAPAERDKDPLEFGYFLMDLGDAADRAAKQGDHLGAARYYRALVKAVPDAAVSYRKACDEYEAAGDLAKARGFCAGALTQPDVLVADYSHYARVVFANKGDLDPKDVQNLDSTVAHLKKEEASRSVAWDIECNLGVHLGDPKRLRDCAIPWAAVAPNEPKVIFFEWVLALHEKNYSEAVGLLKRAKSASVEPERLARMDRATREAMPLWRRGFGDWRFGVVFTVIVTGGIVLVLRRKRPASRDRGPAGPVTYTSPGRSDS